MPVTGFKKQRAMKKLVLKGFAAVAIAATLIPNLANGQTLQNFRSNSQKGALVFEAPKDTVPFNGLKVQLGGHFAQQFQALNHSNTATAVYNADSVNLNALKEIGSGFNLATANLTVDVQLADGVLLNLTTYLSSRHHSETWVKGGFVQIDKLTFLNNATIDKIMKYTRFRLGHMEINYGDGHFRRTDNGNAMYNPFVGNYIMDAFATEVAAEAYYMNKGLMVMAALSNGLINGGVTNPGLNKPAIYGKVAYDKQMNDDLRLRASGSIYYLSSTTRNTLYSGDRTGSRYYLAMENVLASTGSNFTSGRMNPGLTTSLTALQANVFGSFKGIELMGTYEMASGTGNGDVNTRTWNQIAVDLLYRFGKEDKFHVGGRYNTLTGTLPYQTNTVTVDRIQAGGGWYVTPNILAKVEYVTQNYRDFSATDIRNGGNFNGIMIEGVIGF